MQPKDHSAQVEQRIAAIRVSACDLCVFFKSREGALTDVKKCGNCAYATFIFNGVVNSYGLCKYRIQPSKQEIQESK